MSPRRRFQADVPETEDPYGCPREGGSRRMSPRRRIQTDVPETEVPDGCPETDDPDESPRDGRPWRTGTGECP